MFKLGMDMCRILAERIKEYAYDCIDSGNEVTPTDIDDISREFIAELSEGIAVGTKGSQISNKIYTNELKPLKEVYVWINEHCEKVVPIQETSGYRIKFSIPKEIDYGMYTAKCEFVFSNYENHMMQPMIFAVVPR